jgi:hypothetical protein
MSPASTSSISCSAPPGRDGVDRSPPTPGLQVPPCPSRCRRITSISAVPNHEASTSGIDALGDACVDHLVAALQEQRGRCAVARVVDTVGPRALDEVRVDRIRLSVGARHGLAHPLSEEGPRRQCRIDHVEMREAESAGQILGVKAPHRASHDNRCALLGLDRQAREYGRQTGDGFCRAVCRIVDGDDGMRRQ